MMKGNILEFDLSNARKCIDDVEKMDLSKNPLALSILSVLRDTVDMHNRIIHAMFQEDHRMVNMIAILKAENKIMRDIIHRDQWNAPLEIINGFKSMLLHYEARVDYLEAEEEVEKFRLLNVICEGG